ncbi:response regulator [Pseudomonas sp. LPB0260]|jgi:two-component system, chemotaxis family, chemotaxis protein CheY|uniref:response regulator n=1 Tax=unclassified Pseudomonas TaxID=196821 RepID=UPI0015C1E2B6|nr:response regulator [Pseudomonas sp. LPB0260]QLC74251.1 response regulator [Pseudomonas sp. LPB0260]QLC77021.1 response regulator [Pseudomonas sp. LPB0260]
MAQILVVDDSAAIRNEVTAFLKSHNFSVETAVDGKDGLTKLKGNRDIKLIISDVNMPNMDGLTMAEKVRSELGNQTVNIIMLTTENDPNMKTRGKAAGVKGWIVKPFNGANAIGAIQKLVAG